METTTKSRGIEELHRLHYDRLVRAAGRYIDRRDLAEEIVQEAFLSYYTQDRQPQPGSEAAYLRATVMNLSRSALRRRGVEEKYAPVDVMVSCSAEIQALDHIEHRALHREIQQLPSQQRAAVTEHYLRGVPVAGVAAALGISKGSVKQHCFRARASLSTRLEARAC